MQETAPLKHRIHPSTFRVLMNDFVPHNRTYYFVPDTYFRFASNLNVRRTLVREARYRCPLFNHL